VEALECKWKREIAVRLVIFLSATASQVEQSLTPNIPFFLPAQVFSLLSLVSLDQFLANMSEFIFLRISHRSMVRFTFIQRWLLFKNLKEKRICLDREKILKEKLKVNR